MKGWRLPAALAGTLLAAIAARAGTFDLAPDDERQAAYKLTGLLDLRAAATSPVRSWLAGGSGKLRYGGKEGGAGGASQSAGVFAVPQASLVLDAPVPRGPNIHLQLNLDADTDSGAGSAGLVEAYAHTARRTAAGKFGLKAGAFIPPVSWEHTDAAWSTHYTLTPSAIGSWVGEEIRVFGAEASLERRWRSVSARATGAVFEGGDQTGWLLLGRGWSLDDYQAKLNDSFTLPSGVVEQPFRDLDGRAGYYGRLDIGLGADLLKLSGGWWDNNGDPNAYFRQGSQDLPVWSTQFWDAGAKLSWKKLTVLGQFMEGRSAMPTVPRTYWQAWYVLSALELGRWMVSGRCDEFMVLKGRENGYALTGDVQFELNSKSRFSLEYIYVYASPNTVVRPNPEKDEIAQLNYRLKFGG